MARSAAQKMPAKTNKPVNKEFINPAHGNGKAAGNPVEKSNPGAVQRFFTPQAHGSSRWA